MLLFFIAFLLEPVHHLHALHPGGLPRQHVDPLGRVGPRVHAHGQERVHRDPGHLRPHALPLHNAADAVGGEMNTDN